MSGRTKNATGFDDFVLNTYATLFVDPERTHRAAAGLRHLEERRVELARVLRLHKALPQFRFGLGQLAASGPGLESERAADAATWFTDEAAELAAHLRLLRDELTWIAGRPEVTDAGLAVIKGFNNARFYADPTPRWSRDVDVYVPDWASSLVLIGLLRERGYAFDEEECPWFKGEPERGRAEYGQVFLVRREGTRFSRVDIHFGTYSVGAGDYLDFPLTDFYESAGDGANYQGINPTGTLLVMFAHALSDGYVSVKDVNDTVSIALTRSDVDFGTLSQEIRRHSLEPQALLLANHLADTFRDERIREFAEGLRRSAGAGRKSPLWRMHDRDWHRRAAVNASHAFHSALRRRRGPLAAVRRMVQCAVFYNRRLSVAVAERTLVQRALLRLMARTDLTRWRLRSDACPTMIHTGHPALAAIGSAGGGAAARAAAAGAGRRPASGGSPGAGALRRRGSGASLLRPTTAEGVLVGGVFPDQQVVAIGDDVFLCSWDQVVSRGQVALAQSVAGDRQQEAENG